MSCVPSFGPTIMTCQFRVFEEHNGRRAGMGDRVKKELTFAGVETKVLTSHLNLRTSRIDNPILGRSTVTVVAEAKKS